MSGKRASECKRDKAKIEACQTLNHLNNPFLYLYSLGEKPSTWQRTYFSAMVTDDNGNAKAT